MVETTNPNAIDQPKIRRCLRRNARPPMPGNR